MGDDEWLPEDWLAPDAAWEGIDATGFDILWLLNGILQVELIRKVQVRSGQWVEPSHTARSKGFPVRDKARTGSGEGEMDWIM